jgi:hypothetical protein
MLINGSVVAEYEFINNQVTTLNEKNYYLKNIIKILILKQKHFKYLKQCRSVEKKLHGLLAISWLERQLAFFTRQVQILCGLSTVFT